MLAPHEIMVGPRQVAAATSSLSVFRSDNPIRLNYLGKEVARPPRDFDLDPRFTSVQVKSTKGKGGSEGISVTDATSVTAVLAWIPPSCIPM
jgi:hypothetical protein